MINRMINQSEGLVRKHLDERKITASGSNALESKRHDFANFIVLQGRGVVILHKQPPSKLFSARHAKS
jgi:hypothetical protein